MIKPFGLNHLLKEVASNSRSRIVFGAVFVVQILINHAALAEYRRQQAGRLRYGLFRTQL
jgi:hypothetical protein